METTHGQPIGKQISYRPYRKIASFNGYFCKEDFLDWLLDLEGLFDHENIYYERKVGLALYKLNEYALRWWEQVQSDRIWYGKDKIRSWPRSSQLNYFKEPYIPLLREELHVEENTFLEEYVEVKEENIEWKLENVLKTQELV